IGKATQQSIAIDLNIRSGLDKRRRAWIAPISPFAWLRPQTRLPIGPSRRGFRRLIATRRIFSHGEYAFPRCRDDNGIRPGLLASISRRNSLNRNAIARFQCVGSPTGPLQIDWTFQLDRPVGDGASICHIDEKMSVRIRPIDLDNSSIKCDGPGWIEL